ncbi:hypothetical protein ALC62_05646 [Cyphomyrmex costatus]|uniref:Uncharacterized protein n=1 Tax=Cyphomyrmex costatus TaxID=456900 RepID=A0A195CTR0_9HYME|nr:hypothetical protein ALC62_05646 [Cyphomyrmex costatus]
MSSWCHSNVLEKISSRTHRGKARCLYMRRSYVIGKEEAILVDWTLLDLRLQERDRSAPVTTDESGGNKGKESEEPSGKIPDGLGSW